MVMHNTLVRERPYNEIEIGESFSVTKVITEADIANFAGIIGDFNPIHVNPEYAKTTMFGQRIAHGMLTASLMAGMHGWTVSLVALQARCSDAAGQIVRQLARGDQEAAQEAEQHVPEGARVQVVEAGQQITVQVAVDARWGALGPIEIEGRATAPTAGR